MKMINFSPISSRQSVAFKMSGVGRMIRRELIRARLANERATGTSVLD